MADPLGSLRIPGIPPGVFFQPILNAVVDHDPVSREVVDRDPASREVLLRALRPHAETKGEQLSDLFGSDYVSAVLDEVLRYVVARKLVKPVEGGWRRGEKLVIGKPFRLARGYEDTTILVEARDDRLARSAADERAKGISSLVSGGVRTIDRNRLQPIVESMRKHGWLPDLPAVRRKGTHHILDGRHRIAAAKIVGIDPEEHTVEVKFASDEDALEFAIIANRHHRDLTDEEVDAIERIIGGVVPGLTARERARLALLADHRRADREIAKTLGIDHHRVTEARAELLAEGAIEVWDERADAQRRVLDELGDDPDNRPSERQIAARTGVPRTTVQRILADLAGGPSGEGPHLGHPGDGKTGGETGEPSGTEGDPGPDHSGSPPAPPSPPPADPQPKATPRAKAEPKAKATPKPKVPTSYSISAIDLHDPVALSAWLASYVTDVDELAEVVEMLGKIVEHRREQS